MTGPVEGAGLPAGPLAAHALAKPGAWSDSPWGEDHHVAKVADKIFAFLGEDTIGIKCGANRAEADEWLHEFPDDATVMAYIGRSGWNTLKVGGAIDEATLIEAIDASYDLVVAKLPKSRRPRAAD